MSKTQIREQIDGSHATITFFTEDGLNVLSSDALGRFREAVARVSKNNKIRTTVIGAEGKVFVAGADVKAMANYTPADAREFGAMGQDTLNDVAAIPSITVAAINGAAMGGGLELALACDFRIAVKSAKLGLPEVSLGLIPGWNGIPRLTKLVGPAHAKRLYFSGLPVSAEDGAAYGLVDEVVNSVEDLEPRVRAFCKTFRLASPTAIALAKRASRDLDDLSAFSECFQTTECCEGITAFLEKRPAKWMES